MRRTALSHQHLFSQELGLGTSALRRGCWQNFTVYTTHILFYLHYNHVQPRVSILVAFLASRKTVFFTPRWVTEKELKLREIKPLPEVSDRSSRIRQASWVDDWVSGKWWDHSHPWRIWVMYNKSAEELQHLESKSLMKFTAIATTESLWHNFSDTCKRASACF